MRRDRFGEPDPCKFTVSSEALHHFRVKGKPQHELHAGMHPVPGQMCGVTPSVSRSPASGRNSRSN